VNRPVKPQSRSFRTELGDGIFSKKSALWKEIFKIATVVSVLLFTGELFAYGGDINFKEAKLYINRKLDEAIVETDPFPHIIVRDILPPGLYQKILEHWPDSSIFTPSSSPKRRHLYVIKGCAEAHKQLSSSEAVFWRSFGEIVVKYIKNKVIERLTPFLCYKFPNATESELESIRQNMRFFDSRREGLMIDFSGYSIGMHVDQAYLLAGMLIYCPEDDRHMNFGTAFYKAINGETSIDVGTAPSWLTVDSFRLAKKAPYAPNTLVVFMQNPKGWHGVEALNDPSYVRRTYLCPICLDPDFAEELYKDCGFNLNIFENLYKLETHLLVPGSIGF